MSVRFTHFCKEITSTFSFSLQMTNYVSLQSFVQDQVKATTKAMAVTMDRTMEAMAMATARAIMTTPGTIIQAITTRIMDMDKAMMIIMVSLKYSAVFSILEFN